MQPSRRVVFVGHRASALHAARRLGIEIVLLGGDPRHARAEGVVAQRPWPDDPADVAAWCALAAALPEPEGITAVVGLVERSVVPAAALRVALGLGGLDVATAERCTDKLRMKQAVRAAGLPCADFLPVEPDTDPRELIRTLGLPMVLKPRASSGTRGQIRVRAAEDLPEPLPAGYLAESFVRGVEMSCEALLADGRVLFENATQYLVVGAASVVPAPLPAGVAALHHAALAALGIRHGMTHTETFVGEDGPVFGELAARPPGGHIMDLLALAYGFDPWEAWLRIHLGEAPALPQHAQAAAAAWVLHPGAGRVRAVRGLDAVRALPGVVEARLRVAPGDAVAPRTGTGQEIGHLIVVGRDRDEATARLRAAHATLEIEL